MPDQISIIREAFFSSSTTYYTLYDVTGEEASARIADIAKRGDKAVLESLLDSPLLKAGKAITEKPWSLLDHTYHLGNYTLAWSTKDMGFVRVVEEVDSEDPYAADPATQIS